MIKVAVCGASGKMGANIIELLNSDSQAEYFCGVDPRGGGNGVPVYACFDKIQAKPDVIIDFSSPAVLEEELAYAVKHQVPTVIGSTGFTPEQLKKIDETSKKVAIFRTANFSLGINLLCQLVKRAAETLGENFDIEVIEKHHSQRLTRQAAPLLCLPTAQRRRSKAESPTFTAGKAYAASAATRLVCTRCAAEPLWANTKYCFAARTKL